MGKIKERVGEVSVNREGMKMQIEKYRSLTDIDVVFEDGSIRRNISYKDFKNGDVLKSVSVQTRVGEVGENNEGMSMRVIDYRNAKDIDVLFEDGTRVNGTTYGRFKRGNVSK